MPEAARAVGLTLIPPALRDVPAGATTVPTVWSAERADEQSEHAPEQLQEYLDYRRAQRQMQRESMALGGLPFRNGFFCVC